MLAEHMALTANLNRRRELDPFYTAKDFLPRWDWEPMSPENQFELVVALNAAFGGRDLRPKDEDPIN